MIPTSYEENDELDVAYKLGQQLARTVHVYDGTTGWLRLLSN